MGQQGGGDLNVVLQQVALGEAELGKEQLVQIGQVDRVAAGSDGDVGAFRYQ
jgi:hypothetical protein